MEPITWIIILLGLGFILFFIELVILPGLTFAGICSFCCLVCASAWIFAQYGLMWGFISLGCLLVLICIMMAIFFKRKTWRRITLDTELSGSVDTPLIQRCSIGDRGKTLTRLAPMGNVEVNGLIFEAKTIVGFIDPQHPITVTGFDNHSLIVEKTII